MGGGGGSNNGGNDGTYEANIRRDQENERQMRVKALQSNVNSQFDNMFTPDFYEKRAQGLIDYQKPQLDDQYAGAKKQLTYFLSDRGLLDSSVRNDKTAEFQKQYDTGLRGINNAALDLKAKEKADVENTRAGLLNDALVANDTQAALSSLSGNLGQLTQPETYSPLGDIFGTVTGALANQAALERASYLSGGAIKPTFSTGLFAPSSGSVRVTS